VATQAQLDEAVSAYHRLMTGALVVEVHDSNREIIKFNPASAPRLAAYIQELKRELGLTGPCLEAPMRVIF
jgi:hypothetical protein